MKVKIGPIYDRKDYAGFFRRSLAIIIDFVILAIIYGAVLSAWDCFAPPEWVTKGSHIRIKTGLWIMSFVYLIGLRMTANGTLGYRIMRIRYAYMLSERPPMLAIAYRSVLAVVFLLYFAFDHLWILGDERKQAWHDKISGFYVVKCHAQPIGMKRMVQRIANFMMLTFLVWEPVDDEVVKENQK